MYQAPSVSKHPVRSLPPRKGGGGPQLGPQERMKIPTLNPTMMGGPAGAIQQLAQQFRNNGPMSSVPYPQTPGLLGRYLSPPMRPGRGLMV